MSTLRLSTHDAARIAHRDGYRCHWCGGAYNPMDPWEIDHDIAEGGGRGGTHHEKNLKLCHRSCNRDKGTA